jgi:hypothetical protein
MKSCIFYLVASVFFCFGAFLAMVFKLDSATFYGSLIMSGINAILAKLYMED